MSINAFGETKLKNKKLILLVFINNWNDHNMNPLNINLQIQILPQFLFVCYMICVETMTGQINQSVSISANAATPNAPV